MKNAGCKKSRENFALLIMALVFIALISAGIFFAFSGGAPDNKITVNAENALAASLGANGFTPDNDPGDHDYHYGGGSFGLGNSHVGAIFFSAGTDGGTLETGKYCLKDNLEINNSFRIAASADVTFCLGGYRLSKIGSGAVFIVESGATLSIYDDRHQVSTPHSRYIHNYTIASDDIYGKRYVFDDTTQSADLPYVYGGVISGENGITSNGGYVNIYGGTIAGNKWSGLDLNGAGTDTASVMRGGAIIGNSTGIPVRISGSKFIMENGLISDNASEGNSAGVDIQDTAVFEMAGGAIDGNYISSLGYSAGVYVSNTAATFKMSGGSISNNTAGEGFKNSYGSAVSNYGNFYFSGGSITGNRSYQKAGINDISAGAVYNSHNLYLSGSGIIKDNYIAGGEVVSNLTAGTGDIIMSGQMIQPTGTTGPQIGIHTFFYRNDILSKDGGWGNFMGADSLKITDVFFMDDPKYQSIRVTTSGDIEVYNYHVHNKGATDGSEIIFTEELTAENSTVSSSANYSLTANTALDSGIMVTGEGTVVNLCLNGYRLYVSAYGPAISVSSGATFTLYDDVLDIATAPDDRIHNYTVSTAAATEGMYVFDDTTHTTTSDYVLGGVITGLNGAAGVFVNGGVFNMLGGTVAGNTTSGIRVNSGKAEMRGGNVEGNSSDSAAAVMVYSGGTFNLLDGNIHNNKSVGNSHAGGVCNYGVFNMSGGIIEENSSVGRAGGLHNDGTFNMSAGKIINNTNSSQDAGGLYNRGTVNLSGAVVVTGNTSGGEASNIDMTAGPSINITGTLIRDASLNGMQLGVTGDDGKLVTSGYAANNSLPLTDFFFADDPKYFGIRQDGAGDALIYKFHVHNEGAADEMIFDKYLTADTTAISADSNYVLESNLILNGTLNIQSASATPITVGICLNGHMLSNDRTANAKVIEIGANATLNIYDDDWSGTTDETVNHYFSVADNGQYLFKESSAGATGSVKGGVISGENGITLNETTGGLKIYGGNISGCGNSGIIINKGSVNIFMGAISGNYASSEGGGVRVAGADASFAMNGGVIFQNASGNAGGGLFNRLGDVTINIGEFSLNKASKGGAIYSELGDVTINTGEFSLNKASKGGAIYSEGGNLTITGGTISSNEGTDNYGGIYFTTYSAAVRYAVNFDLWGSPIIKDNFISQDSKPSNVYLESGDVITLGGTMVQPYGTSGSWIGVETKDGSGVFTENWQTDSLKVYDVFFADDSKYKSIISSQAGEAELFEYHVHNKGATDGTELIFDKVLTADTTSINQTGNYFLTSDTGMKGVLNISSASSVTVKICLNGYRLFNDGTTDGRAITVGVSGQLYVYDDAWDPSTAPDDRIHNYSVSQINKGAFEFNDATHDRTLPYVLGGVISGKNMTCVSIVLGATFYLNSGTIAGGVGSASSKGGGVYNNGNFRMYGGKITGNSSTTGGGGVYNDRDFQIFGGIITGNAATDGGGIYSAGENSALTLSGSIIIKDNATVTGSDESDIFIGTRKIKFRTLVKPVGTTGPQIGISNGTTTGTITSDWATSDQTLTLQEAFFLNNPGSETDTQYVLGLSSNAANSGEGVVRAVNKWIMTYVNAGWTYGETYAITDGDPKYGSYQIKYYSDADHANEIISPSWSAATAAGTYYFVVENIAETDDYTSLSGSSNSFTVSKAQLTLTFSAAPEVEYGDTPQFGGYSLAGFKNGESASGTVSGTAVFSAPSYSNTGGNFSAVGSTHAISLTGLTADNYTFAMNDTQKLTVIKKIISTADVVWASNGSLGDHFTYNAEDYISQITAKYTLVGASAPTAFGFTAGSPDSFKDHKDAGYAFTIDTAAFLAANSSYEFASDFVDTKTYFIDKLNVTIIADDVLFTYNDAVPATLTWGYPEPASPGESVNKFFAQDNVSVSVSTNYTKGTDAGTANLNTIPQAGGARLFNYDVTAVNGTVTVNKITFDQSALSWNYSGAIEYDGAEHEILLNGSLPDGFTATYANDATYANKGIDAATYIAAVTIGVTNATNYEVTGTGITNLEWKITPKSIAYVWNYAENGYTYTGQPQGPDGAASINGVPITGGNEILNISLSDGAIVVGTDYTRTASIASVTGGQASADNYTLTNVTSDKYQIKAADFNNFSAGAAYNGIYDAAEHAFVTGNTAEAVDGTQVLWSFYSDAAMTDANAIAANKKYKNAGTHTIYYKVTAANHNEKAGSYSVTITPKELTVVIEDKTSAYDSEPETLTCSLKNGFAMAGSETLADLKIGFNCEVTAASDVGEYDITAGYNNSNYTVTFENEAGNGSSGIYRITVAVNNWITEYARQGWTYNETPSKETAPKAAFGDAVIQYYTDEACTKEFTGTFTNTTNAGTYYAKATVAATNNYNGLENNYSFAISKATYDMSGATWSDTVSFVYDESEKFVTVTGLPSGVTIKTYSNNTATNVGDYTASVTFNYDTVNYNEPTLANCNWSITQATNAWITEFAREGWVYNGNPTTETAPVATFGSPDLKYYTDEACTNEFTGTFTNTTNAGTYYVKATVAATDNYTGLENNYSFAISKASYDMSGAKWSDTVNFVYDESEKSVTVTGLPSGVTVKNYSNNTATNVGDYTASVTFNYDTVNYNAPALSECAWSITQATNAWITEFARNGWVYNNDPSAVTVPVSVFGTPAVKYYTDEACTQEFVGTFSDTTNAGNYYAKVTVEGTSNYSELDKTYVFTVSKAVYDMSGVTFENKTFLEDGDKVFNLEVENLPDGVTVAEYINNGKKDPGVYVVTARFAGDSDNFQPIPDITARMTINYKEITGGEKDEEANSDVVVTHENGMHPTLNVAVERVDGSGITLSGSQDLLQVLNVLLQNSAGETVSPRESVIIKLLIPVESRDMKNLKVYRVQEDGTLTDMNAVKNGAYMVFETAHFAEFVIAGDAEKVDGGLSKNAIIGMSIGIPLFVILLAAVVSLIIKKKKDKERNMTVID